MNSKGFFTTVCLLATLVLSACAVPFPIVPAPVQTMDQDMDEETMEEPMAGEEMADGAMGDDAMAEGEQEGEMMGETMMGEDTTFHVRIENISGNSMLATPFSPGVWVLHSEPGPIFTPGEPNRGEGLEAQSEDGNPMALEASLEATHFPHGIFNMPAGTDMRGAAVPGVAFEFEIVATPDTPYLSFTSMFGQSNDLFIAPNENGIALFDDSGHPTAGDVTNQIQLWDAGTEMNEEPGMGPNQAPRQPAPNTGPADEDNTVRLVNDIYSYPAVTELVRVTIEPAEMMEQE